MSHMLHIHVIFIQVCFHLQLANIKNKQKKTKITLL